MNPEGFDIWNFPFNVDWSRDLGGGLYRGHSARSTDVVAGVRYKVGSWVANVGLLHLGEARTANPSERGQSNSATIGTVGLGYNIREGLRVYALAGAVSAARLGLSPLSMPSNSAFTSIDTRLTRQGHWLGAGVVYVF